MKDQKFLNLIKDTKTVLIIASRPLDFDCLSSGLILKKYLESLEKQVTFIFPSKITKEEKEGHSFLPYFFEVEDRDTREILSKRNFDVLILIDGMNLVQFYDTSLSMDNPPSLDIYPLRIHIDHHLQKADNLGTYILHNPKASSATEVVLTQIIPEEFIDQKIATLGYIGIASDTGNFRWNFTPATMELTAKLLKKGVDPRQFLEMYFSKTRVYMKMLSWAIENTIYDDRLGSTFLFLPYQKLQEAGIDEEKLSELKKAFDMDMARYIPQYPRGFLVYERKPGQITIGARGNNLTNKINLPQMFIEMGGSSGGHFNASGLRIEGDFNKVQENLMGLLNKYQQGS